MDDRPFRHSREVFNLRINKDFLKRSPFPEAGCFPVKVATECKWFGLKEHDNNFAMTLVLYSALAHGLDGLNTRADSQGMIDDLHRLSIDEYGAVQDAYLQKEKHRMRSPISSEIIGSGATARLLGAKGACCS